MALAAKQADPEVLVEASVPEQNGLLNCHFSVNNIALREGVLRPMVAEIIAETRQAERLSLVEDTVKKLQVSLETKADAKVVRDISSDVKEQYAQLQSKAERKDFASVSSVVTRMEQELSWKADHTALEEVAAVLQRVQTLSAQKADLSYVNRNNAALVKLTHTVSQQEKTLAEALAAVKSLDPHFLPTNVQRLNDGLRKTNTTLKQVQEIVATKAEQNSLEDLGSVAKGLEKALTFKANHQSVIEMKAEIHDVRHQLGQKTDYLKLDETRTELQRVTQMLATKVEQQECNELKMLAHGLQQSLDQKADVSQVMDVKCRMGSVETNKADRREMVEALGLIQKLQQDSTELKAFRAAVADLPTDVGRVQADVQAINETNRALHRLEQIAEQKADIKIVDRNYDEINQRLDSILEQVRQKADHSQIEDTSATLRSIVAAGQCNALTSSPSQSPSGSNFGSSVGSATFANTRSLGSPKTNAAGESNRRSTGNSMQTPRTARTSPSLSRSNASSKQRKPQ